MKELENVYILYRKYDDLHANCAGKEKEIAVCKYMCVLKCACVRVCGNQGWYVMT